MQQTFFHIREYIRWYVLLLLTVISFALYSIIIHENRNGVLTFTVLDVGQGDSLFIESPTGTQVLIDGGPGKNIMKEISGVMPWYDRHIDMIVVTNPDTDHYEGFFSLLDKYSVDTVLESGTVNKYVEYSAFEKLISDKKIKEVLARRGQRIDLGGGAYLQIFFPDRDVTNLSSNDGSVVMKLVYGETSVLLQGDSTAAIEHYLVGLNGANLKSDIIKIGHHGSRTSSSEEYIASVLPKWAVISSGTNNSYGHPTEQTLNTLNKFNIQTIDTCNSGDIIFKSDGKSFVLRNKNPKPVVVGCRST